MPRPYIINCEEVWVTRKMKFLPKTVLLSRSCMLILWKTNTRYSLVTGKIQKTIKELVPEEKLITVGRITINYDKSLVDKVKESEVETQ